MLVGLAYMAAMRGYQWYERRAALYNERHTPSSLYVAQPDALPAPAALEDWAPAKEDLFLEEKPLTQMLQEQQAKETITSILNDYRMDPAFRKFNAELERITEGKIKDFEELSNQSLSQILQDNPQIVDFANSSETKEDFARILQEIFSNPQFQKSVQKLQGGSVPAQGKTGRSKSE